MERGLPTFFFFSRPHSLSLTLTCTKCAYTHVAALSLKNFAVFEISRSCCLFTNPYNPLESSLSLSLIKRNARCFIALC